MFPRLAATVRTLHERFGFAAGLAAVYAPPLIALAVAWHVPGKIVLTIVLWALEGIAWAWRDERRARRAPPLTRVTRANG